MFNFKLTPKVAFAIICLANCLLFTNCTDDTDCESPKTYVYLNQSEIERFKYKGYEMLHFVNTKTNEKIQLRGHGYSKGWLVTQKFDGPCSTIYNYEILYLDYISKDSLYNLKIKVYANYNVSIEFDSTRTTAMSYDFSQYSSSLIHEVSVQDTFYDNVVWLKKTDDRFPGATYYNLDIGVIKMISKNNDVWELYKIDSL